jgi:hypothetical protein
VHFARLRRAELAATADAAPGGLSSEHDPHTRGFGEREPEGRATRDGRKLRAKARIRAGLGAEPGTTPEGAMPGGDLS